MDNKEKSVEQQILESDILNRLKKAGDKKNEEIFKSFLAMPKELQKVTLFCKHVANDLQMNEDEMAALCFAMTFINKQCPMGCSILINSFFTSWRRLRKENNQ